MFFYSLRGIYNAVKSVDWVLLEGITYEEG
jgi:hypothetical protein